LRFEEVRGVVDEKIRMDADIDLSKLVKLEEEEEVPEFDVKAWMKEFTAKKKKEDVAARRKKKILRGPTALQQRREHERYLKNMKGWKLVQLKPKSDQEVFDLYQQARREMDTFYPMGCAEDLEHFAQMNKKLVPEKVIEAEQVKLTETKIPPSQSVKRKSVGHKTFARKKKKISDESSSDVDKAEEVEEEHETTLAVWSELEEPEVIKEKPWIGSYLCYHCPALLLS
jgi:hypothetical protein